MTEERRVSEMNQKEINDMICKGVLYIDTEHTVPLAKSVLRQTHNLRLVGDTGAGKTQLVHKLSEVFESPLFETVLTRDVTKWDLLCADILKDGSTTTRDGIVVQWLKAKEGILYLDGFNYADPSILSLVEPLADFREKVWVSELSKSFTRTDKHFFIISYNPSEKIGYSGTYTENIATIRRFEGLEINYLPARQERILLKQFSKDYEFISKWVELARKTREKYSRGEFKTPITTGNLINYAKLRENENMDEKDILRIARTLFPSNERDDFDHLFENLGEIDAEIIDKLRNESVDA